MQQIDNELDLIQQQLSLANSKLDEKDKALANVSQRDAIKAHASSARTISVLLFTFRSFFFFLLLWLAKLILG